MEIFLIRHTSVDVPPGICYGQTDVPLTASFPQEAAQVRDALVGIPFDGVWSSPLSRCMRLAEACGWPTPQQDARLMELNFGEWEMQPFEQIDDPRLQSWYDDYLHVRTTGGESFQDQYKRVVGFLDELRQTGMRRAAIFTHGGVIRCARLYAQECSSKEAFAREISYGEIVRMEL